MRGLKVVIPSAGEGQRLRPHTLHRPKVMLEVAGKPIIGHIIERLLPLRPEMVIVVVPPQDKTIEEYLRGEFSLTFQFVIQPRPRGLADAILCAEDLIQDCPMLIILGDTILDLSLKDFLQEENAIGVKEVVDPRRFGVVKLTDGLVQEVIEKPSQPVSKLAIVGIYYFSNPTLVFTALHRLIEENRMVNNEYQFTDALSILVNEGIKIRAVEIEGWFDCGTPQALIDTNRSLLKLNTQTSKIQIQKTSSVICPPVYIAENAIIENSVVGPYVSISKGAKIINSVVSDTLVYHNAIIENAVILQGIIGEYARVEGRKEMVNVGPGEKVGFPS